MAEQNTPEKGVASRAEGVRQERRRKPGSVATSGLKLAVDRSKLDFENYHYRQVNDVPGRVQTLHDQDYDPAPEADANVAGKGIGTVNTAQAGVADGKPYNAVLMRKPRHMHEADQKEKQRPLDEMDDAILRGNTNHKGNDLRGPDVYTPGAGNEIAVVSKRA